MDENFDRTTGIGGSEIAAILGGGMHPFKSRMQVWAEKLGCAPEFHGNRRTEWGNKLEPVVAEDYAVREGVSIVTAESLVGSDTLRHPDYPWMFASPDRLIVEDRRILEIKVVGSEMVRAWGNELEGPEGIPDYVNLQARWYMAFPWFDGEYAMEADVVALLGGNDDRTYRIYRDEAFEAELIELSKRFWDLFIVTGDPPPPSKDDEDRKLLGRFYGDTKLDLLPATPDVERQVERLICFRNIKQIAAGNEELVKQEICRYIGGAPGLTCRYGNIYWKLDKAGNRPFNAHVRFAEAS